MSPTIIDVSMLLLGLQLRFPISYSEVRREHQFRRRSSPAATTREDRQPFDPVFFLGVGVDTSVAHHVISSGNGEMRQTPKSPCNCLLRHENSDIVRLRRR
ncbi:hypothetical protein MRB53_032708 [Persea americana]|uniref:Uncharacterized protein n=1 Tax=Persea americana TaxID=3435 RepID=A0ACC2KT64_PERAE|nr:hypothetical protein MRB53_032708 [Persea americana]